MCLLDSKYNCQLLRHVQGFPLLRLLWADLTSKGSSLVLLFWLNIPTTVLVELLWISQVLNTSLYTCHGLITPLTRHNQTSTAVLHGLRWRYKPRQSDLKFIGAIPALQGHDSPYGLYDSLCTLHQYCSRDAVLTAEKQSLISLLRQWRNTRYRWLVKPYLTGTCTLQDASSLA